MRTSILAGFFATAVVSVIACSSSERETLNTNNGGNAGNAGTPTVGSQTGDNNPTPTIVTGPGGDSGVQMADACVPDPSHFEVPGNNCDDDGDGKVDNADVACDTSIAIDGDAEKFANALGLCKKASGSSWGLVSASYRRGYNDTKAPPAEQHGIMGSFGSALTPREGSSFGVLASGFARPFDDDGSANKHTSFKNGTARQGGFPLFGPSAPPGFPKSAAGCPNIAVAQDISVVHLEIKVPTNAKGIQFDFNFLSGEWPEWVCTAYNDSFIAYLKSAAFNNGQPDNVSFDSKGAPVSVNNAFFDRCTPNSPTGCMASLNMSPTGTAACAGGESELAGTGFDTRGTYCGGQQTTGGGGTGWLTSTAPVQPGETITLEFYVWDGTDGRYDSSVLLDNFRWVPEPIQAPVTTRPPK